MAERLDELGRFPMTPTDTRLSPKRHFVTDKELVAKRRRQICDAALELFGRQGFNNTTIQEIANLGGISPGLIYQYCEDKHDVLLLVISRCIDEYKDRLTRALDGESDPVTRLTTIIDTYCRSAASMRAAIVLMYRSSKTLPLAKRSVVMAKEKEVVSLISSCVQAAIDSGRIRPVNAVVVASQVTMYAHAYALKGWILRDELSLEDYIAHGTEFFLRGLRTSEL